MSTSEYKIDTLYFFITSGKPPVPPGSQKEPLCHSDKSVTSPTDNEITLQWYHPSLEEADPLRPEAAGPESKVLLMYALNSKVAGATATKMLWVSLSQINDLHDR